MCICTLAHSVHTWRRACDIWRCLCCSLHMRICLAESPKSYLERKCIYMHKEAQTCGGDERAARTVRAHAYEPQMAQRAARLRLVPIVWPFALRVSNTERRVPAQGATLRVERHHVVNLQGFVVLEDRNLPSGIAVISHQLELNIRL